MNRKSIMPATHKILLLSGYHAASHRYWCEQLIAGMPQFHWTEAALPDRHFYWRIRSNALSFAYQSPELNGTYDLLLATSMVDICNLRGLLPHLSALPTVLYFHENQFAYPERKPNSNLINAQLTSVYGALVADKLVFNSDYNRDSFFEGARALFDKMPDGTPKNLLAELPSRSVVIPVPVADNFASDKTRKNSPIEILWNHRWEYDKQPQVFFAAIKRLIDAGYALRLHVMGQSFREVPPCFDKFRQSHGDTVVTWGYQPADIYQQILQRADIVVSAALHDFQGLGMLEAIAAGCIPIAPDRMAYPEYVPDGLRYGVASEKGTAADGELHESQQLYQKLVSVIDTSTSAQSDIQRYKTSEVLPVYSKLIGALLK